MEPIGIVRTPFTQQKGMPIQPGGGRDVRGELIIKPEFCDGLADLDGLSHIYILYLFHQVPRTELTVVPFLDSSRRGVFATRFPLRPNHIGLSVVELTGVAGCRVGIQNIDVLDDTPLLDIKPYIPVFDAVPDARPGWMRSPSAEVDAKRSDHRFT